MTILSHINNNINFIDRNSQPNSKQFLFTTPLFTYQHFCVLKIINKGYCYRMYLISFRHWLAARNLTTLLCVVLKRHHIRYGQRTYLPATSVSGVCVKLLIPAFVHSSANHQIYIFPVIKERLLDSRKQGGERGDEESYILSRYWNLRKLIVIFS